MFSSWELSRGWVAGWDWEVLDTLFILFWIRRSSDGDVPGGDTICDDGAEASDPTSMSCSSGGDIILVGTHPSAVSGAGVILLTLVLVCLLPILIKLSILNNLENQFNI